MKKSKAEVLDRQNRILEFLQENPSAEIPEISGKFSISVATVRRDIAALKKSGDIKNLFNGFGHVNQQAYLPQFDEERYLLSNIEEKESIARAAAEMLENGDTVFVNSSSTALRIYPYIKDKSVIIVTNNGRSLTAKRNHGTELIILGGEVALSNSHSNMKMSMTGEFAIENIHRIAATKCILGVSGISADKGLTSMAIQDPPINRAMIQRCNGPVIVVADHRKIGIEHNFRFGWIKSISCLITDSKSNADELDKIRKAGVKVVVVETDSTPESN